MSGDIKENVTRRSIWLRLGFMIILGMAFSLAEVITSAVIAFQFLASLFTGQTNDQLTRFGRNLARYLQQITVYMTFATEEKPFPFAPWPDEPHQEPPHEDVPVEEDSNQLNDKSENAGDATENDKPESAGNTTANGKPESGGEVTENDETSEAKIAEATQTAVFADSSAYQKFMGERSRLGAQHFLKLLTMPPGLRWLDVGCGTGAFSAVIMDQSDPAEVVGVDNSEPLVAHAQAEIGNDRASFRTGDATALPFGVDEFDVAVSSYVLNFVPDKQKMVDEMARVVRPEGTVAISVFDVAGGRQSSHHIWELIGKNDAAFHRAEFEKRGWDITHPDALSGFFVAAGLDNVTVDSIEFDEPYGSFDEYWEKMTSLPTSGTSLYVKTLSAEQLIQFKSELRLLLPNRPDGSFQLVSGSWVVRGTVPA